MKTETDHLPDHVEKRFNIWMITKWYPNREDPQFGVFIQKHARAISQHNNISVLYIHSAVKPGKVFEIEENDKNGFKEIIVYYRNSASLLGKIINICRYYSSMKKGLKILAEYNPRPDIIHAYILTRPGIVAWYLSWRKNIPYIVSEQWSGYLTGKYLNSSLFKKIINRFVIRKAAAVTAVSLFLLKKMKECGLKNIDYRVIPNVIEFVQQNIIQINKNQINVLMVADLVDEIKNISGVIRMISQLGPDNYRDEKSFVLRIIGGGADEEKLKKLAAGFHLIDRKIFFEGPKNNNEVYDYLRQCDFLIMNSRYETFSLICAEAMSCGKPVIATRCGGPNEFVNADTGLLIEPDNASELKSGFSFMLNNFQNYDSAFIKNYSNDLFSMKKISETFQILYNSIITK